MTDIKLGRIAIVAIGALSLATAAADSLRAQGADARWQAWTGCWAPVAPGAAMQRDLTSGATLCVIPAQGTSAVEVVTIVGGKVEDRTRIEADGISHPVSRDGCTGSETATWATTGTRVYLTSDMTCAGGVTRRGKGVMSFNQRYEWLEVRGVQSGDASGVAVTRYAALSDTTKLPAEIARLVPARGAMANNAILAASAPLTLADIADIATRVDSGVAATWLVERTTDVKLSITGKQLAALSDQGVPAAVIDVLVAIAHPSVFALDANTREAGFKAQEQRGGGQYGYRGTYGNPYYYGWMSSRMSYGMYSPFYYGMYDPFYGYGFRYGGYGYGSGGYGYYSPYYGYYPGSQPIIVVTRPADGNPGYSTPTHGRVTKGQGYTEGRSSSGTTSGGASSSSSPSSSGSSSAGSAAGSSGGDRTAVRKPPQ